MNTKHKQRLDAYLGLMSMHGENSTLVKSLLSKQKSCIERPQVVNHLANKSSLKKQSQFEFLRGLLQSPTTQMQSKKEAVKVTQFQIPLAADQVKFNTLSASELPSPKSPFSGLFEKPQTISIGCDALPESTSDSRSQ